MSEATYKDKNIGEMDPDEREKYFEYMGIKPKRVEEYETEENSIPVHEEEEEKEERKEEELEQYRETTGF